MHGHREPRSRRETARRIGLIAVPSTAVALAVLGVLHVASTGGDDVLGVAMAIGATAACAVGAVILWLRPGQGIGRILLAVGVIAAASLGIQLVMDRVDPYTFEFGQAGEAINAIAGVLSSAAILVGSVVVVVRFPSGHRTSRLGTIIELVVLVMLLGVAVAILVPEAFERLEAASTLIIFGIYPLAAADVIIRYRRAPAQERAQFRWLIASSSLSAALVVVMLVGGDAASWAWSAWLLSTILPTLAIGVAITRYHLYEIDRIISRTLTYGGVTVGLFIVFVAANLVAQWALTPFTNGNAIAVAGSTLIAAAAFSPMRARLQQVVDRRFNRGRYDAERTIDSFAGRLRDELDLTTLAEALQHTTRAAVEPASTAVWLRGGAWR